MKPSAPCRCLKPSTAWKPRRELHGRAAVPSLRGGGGALDGLAAFERLPLGEVLSSLHTVA